MSDEIRDGDLEIRGREVREPEKSKSSTVRYGSRTRKVDRYVLLQDEGKPDGGGCYGNGWVN